MSKSAIEKYWLKITKARVTIEKVYIREYLANVPSYEEYVYKRSQDVPESRNFSRMGSRWARMQDLFDSPRAATEEARRRMYESRDRLKTQLDDLKKKIDDFRSNGPKIITHE